MRREIAASSARLPQIPGGFDERKGRKVDITGNQKYDKKLSYNVKECELLDFYITIVIIYPDLSV